jgi:hypothetical protein
MNGKKILGVTAIGVGALLAWKYFTKAKGLEYLQASVKDAGIKAEALYADVDLLFSLHNPTANKYQLKSFTGGIYLDGQMLGTISASKPIEVPPFTDVEVPTNSRLDYLSNLSNVYSLLTNVFSGTLPNEFYIEGTLQFADGLEIPFKNSFIEKKEEATTTTTTTTTAP